MRTVSQHLRLGQHRLLAPRPITPSRVRTRSSQAGLSSGRPEIQKSCHTPRSQGTRHGNAPCRAAVPAIASRSAMRRVAPRTRVPLYHVAHFHSFCIQRSSGELASYQQKMFRIDDHVGIAIAGLTSDARVLRSVPLTLSPIVHRCSDANCSHSLSLSVFACMQQLHAPAGHGI